MLSDCAPKPHHVQTSPEAAGCGSHTASIFRVARGADTDAVWWRPGKDGAYQPFADAEIKAMETRFAEHGRSHVLDLLERPTA